MRAVLPLTLLLIAQFIPVNKAQSQNVVGTWNVEITFGNDQHRSVHFQAQPDGKGTLMPADPRSKVWGAAKRSDAKWSQEDGKSVKFSGEVEFLLGNVGRDAGMLVCTGKFETGDLIAGDVEFSPLAGDGPSKFGTFKAMRAPAK